jgi:hypothetical protein
MLIQKIVKKIHAVLPQRNIMVLAKQYGLTVADLYKETNTRENRFEKGGK